MRRIVLLVEKDERFRRFWRRVLEKAGLEVVVISSPEEMVDTVRKSPFDFIFLGRQQRDTATLNCLRKVREFMQEVTVAAPLLPEELLKEVEAIEDFGYRADLALTPDAVRLESRTVSEFIALFHEKQPDPYRFENFIGKSPGMEKVFALMTRAVRQDVSTVLVTGETGTGKELVARALHYNGQRARQPFIDVNCSALPEQLLEGELFGYEKGAFTDAKAAKPGLMEMADGGTLFLDEVSEMQPSVQAKLLRVIETRTLRRLGGVENIQVDVNVVAATNRDLRSEVASWRFREDLYHRLNVFNIALPPLRERPGDLIPLVEHFIARNNHKFQKNIRSLSPAAYRLLRTYRWPGNVRELKNAIEHAFILADGDTILSRHLPEHLQTPAGVEVPGMLGAVEKKVLEDALGRSAGNQTRAAEILGISRYSLRRRLKKHGLL